MQDKIRHSFKFHFLFSELTNEEVTSTAAKTASLNDYLLISVIVLLIIGILILSIYLLKVKKAKANYKVNQSNQANQQETHA